MQTDPLYYGLPTRVQLKDLGNNRLGMRKVMKSRIIQKDAARIIEIAKQIKSVHPELDISLICTRNICSKSIELLKEEGIGLIFIE
ncbi:MAG TPA: hypothetical protein P5084_15395 [Paludibacter sp.]|nr:hypothetical protein [Paludibacter sp.]